MQRVKIQIYSQASEATYIDSFEGQDFGDFILVSINMHTLPQEELNDLYNAFQDAVSEGKKVIIVDNSLDIDVFGFREQINMIEAGTENDD